MVEEPRDGDVAPRLLAARAVEADMAAIKAFYAPFKGKNATQFEAGSN